ncbi:MAG: hypothetical protein AAF621_00530 [Pseudomonadota bacterium]
MDFTSILEEASARSGVSEIATRFDTILTLAERYLNRALKGASRSTTTISVTTDANGDYNLPSDYNGLKSVFKNKQKLHNATEQYVRGFEGKNGFYIQGTTLKSQLPNTDLSISYYANLPTLKTNTTNWLSDEDSEIYIYAVMWQGITFASMKAKDRAQIDILSTKIGPAKAYLDELISQYKENDRLNRISGIRVNIGAIQ